MSNVVLERLSHTVANLAARLRNLETQEIALANLPSVPMAHAYHDADQTASNGVALALAMNSERFDTDTIHDPASNNSRLTCQTAGKYLIVGQAAFAANTTGQRDLYIRLNGTTYIAVARNDVPDASLQTVLAVSTVWDLAATQYVELVAYQDSGGDLAVVALSAWTPEFSMTRVG